MSFITTESKALVGNIYGDSGIRDINKLDLVAPFAMINSTTALVHDFGVVPAALWGHDKALFIDIDYSVNTDAAEAATNSRNVLLMIAMMNPAVYPTYNIGRALTFAEEAPLTRQILYLQQNPTTNTKTTGVFEIYPSIADTNITITNPLAASVNNGIAGSSFFYNKQSPDGADVPTGRTVNPTVSSNFGVFDKNIVLYALNARGTDMNAGVDLGTISIKLALVTVGSAEYMKLKAQS